jgi:hypothetical protein
MQELVYKVSDKFSKPTWDRNRVELISVVSV